MVSRYLQAAAKIGQFGRVDAPYAAGAFAGEFKTDARRHSACLRATCGKHSLIEAGIVRGDERCVLKTPLNQRPHFPERRLILDMLPAYPVYVGEFKFLPGRSDEWRRAVNDY